MGNWKAEGAKSDHGFVKPNAGQRRRTPLKQVRKTCAQESEVIGEKALVGLSLFHTKGAEEVTPELQKPYGHRPDKEKIEDPYLNLGGGRELMAPRKRQGGEQLQITTDFFSSQKVSKNRIMVAVWLRQFTT